MRSWLGAPSGFRERVAPLRVVVVPAQAAAASISVSLLLFGTRDARAGGMSVGVGAGDQKSACTHVFGLLHLAGVLCESERWSVRSGARVDVGACYLQIGLRVRYWSSNKCMMLPSSPLILWLSRPHPSHQSTAPHESCPCNHRPHPRCAYISRESDQAHTCMHVRP